MSWGSSWKPLLLRWAILLVVLVLAFWFMSGCSQKPDEPVNPPNNGEEHKHPDDGQVTKPPEVQPEDPRCVGVAYSTHTVLITKYGMSPPELNLRSKAYEPRELTVQVCDKVVWENQDFKSSAMYHTATSGNPDVDKVDDPNYKPRFDSGGLVKGAKSKPVQFTDSGEYPYFCKPHHWMRGKVKVVSRRK